MADDALDLQARKQLLLTRIAMERVQWTHDIAMVRVASSPRHLASHAVRSVLPDRLGDALFSTAGGSRSGRSVAASVGQGAMQAVLLARRYPVVLSLIGALLARRTIRRLLMFGTTGAAIAAGVWLLRQSRSD